MNSNEPIYTWHHRDQSKQVIGHIKRFIDDEGRKVDIPFYQWDGKYFKAGIPESMKQSKYPLFGLETIVDKNRVVIICEGQKSQAAFAGLGFQCVTSILGAMSAHLSEWSTIADFESVYFAMDNDSSGEMYVKSVYEILSSFNSHPDCRIIQLPDLTPKGDICDWLKQQAELNNWNELSSLSHHSSVEVIKQRLQTSIAANLKPIPLEWKEHTANQINLTEMNDSSWPDPEPIQSELLPVKPLSPHLIPEPLRDWITDVADRMQCPIDFLAVAALVVIGSLVGAGCGIKPKKWDGWLVIPNLWGGVVGRPGMLKTPAISEVMQLLALLETEAKNDFDTRLSEYQMAVEIFKTQKEAFKTEMITAQKNAIRKKAENTLSPTDLKEQFLNLKEPAKPVWKRYKTNDVTIEKLHELLKENPRGLLLYRDELMGLLSTWDKDGRETDRAFFLEAWNGDGSLTTDRIGRGTVHTENLCLSIFGSTQPAKLTKYLYGAINGIENDGLLQRFQLLVYPDEVKNWKLIDRVPNPIAKQRVVSLIKTIVDMNFEEQGATRVNEDKSPSFKFSEDAQSCFYKWLTDHEQNKLMQENNDILVEHLAKFRSLVPSLALLFHIIDLADGKKSNNVSLQAIKCAIEWSEYLESHARRIYHLGLDTNYQAAIKLAKKIQASDLPNRFTLRDIYRRHWGMLNDKEVVRLACEELVEAGWLRPESTEPYNFGRPKSVTYLVNPKVKLAK